MKGWTPHNILKKMYKEEKWAILKIRLELWKTKSFICKKKWPKDWYNAIVYIPECMFFTDYIFLLFIFHSPPLPTSSWFFIIVSRISNKCGLNWYNLYNIYNAYNVFNVYNFYMCDFLIIATYWLTPQCSSRDAIASKNVVSQFYWGGWFFLVGWV